MTVDPPPDEADDSGLRFRRKAPGSPFELSSRYPHGTLSCFLCGLHRPRHLLKTRKLIGRNQFVCGPSCKELQARLAGV